MDNKPLLSFHGQQSIKDHYIARVKAHQAADQIIQGNYWVNGKGCAVGCTIHGADHSKYETELGIPRIIARLEDRIFEGLSNEEAKDFPLQFLEAIPVGVDLTPVWKKFLVWLLVDEKEGVIRHAKKDSERKAIQDVADLIQKSLTEKVEIEKFDQARRAAAAAYADAADADAADAADAAAAAYAAYAAAADADAAAAAADADAAAADADAADAAAADADAAAADADAADAAAADADAAAADAAAADADAADAADAAAADAAAADAAAADAAAAAAAYAAYAAAADAAYAAYADAAYAAYAAAADAAAAAGSKRRKYQVMRDVLLDLLKQAA